MKDGESKDLIKEIIGKFGSKDVENVKEMAKELLLEEDNDRDWRELFTDTDQDRAVIPKLKKNKDGNKIIPALIRIHLGRR